MVAWLQRSNKRLFWERQGQLAKVVEKRQMLPANKKTQNAQTVLNSSDRWKIKRWRRNGSSASLQDVF